MKYFWGLLLAIGGVLFIAGLLYGVYLQIKYWDLSEYGLLFKHPLENVTCWALCIVGGITFYGAATKLDRYGSGSRRRF